MPGSDGSNGGDGPVRPQDKRTFVGNGYVDGNGNFFRDTGRTTGGEQGNTIFEKMPGQFKAEFVRTSGGDGGEDIFKAVQINAPAAKKAAAPAGPTAAQRAAERASAESAARDAAEKAAAQREELSQRQAERAANRDDRPLTRGNTGTSRRPASTELADDAVEGVNLLGAAVTRLEDRQRDLVSTRRGRGSLFGTG